MPEGLVAADVRKALHDHDSTDVLVLPLNRSTGSSDDRLKLPISLCFAVILTAKFHRQHFDIVGNGGFDLFAGPIIVHSAQDAWQIMNIKLVLRFVAL